MYIKVLATATVELIASDQPLVKYFDFCEHDFKNSNEAIEYMQDWFMQNTAKPKIYDFYRKHNRKPTIDFLRTDANPLLEEDEILLPKNMMVSQREIHPDIFKYAKMDEEDFLLLGLYYAYFDKSEDIEKDLEDAKKRLVYDERIDEDEFIARQVEEGNLPPLKDNATYDEKLQYERDISKLVDEKFKGIDMLWFKA